MSVYEWCQKEYTCDGCGKKHKMPDREESIPNGWVLFVGEATSQASSGTSSGPSFVFHCCSKQCLCKCIGDMSPIKYMKGEWAVPFSIENQ